MRYLLAAFFCFNIGFAQQTGTVDFQRIEAYIGPDAKKQKIEGQYIGTFKVLRDTDSIYLDAVNMIVEDLGTTGFQIQSNTKKIWFLGDFKKDSTYVARFWYEAQPKQTVYFTEDQIWTQGQGKYTSHWLPSLDDMNDKIEFDIQYIVPDGKSVVANGNLLEVQDSTDITAWRFDMEKPMSSYLVAFAMGDFAKQTTTSESGIPIELYFRPEDAAKAEPTYRYTKEIFDFLEKEIGVPYPWQNYKQVPVRDFLYAGMENTTATIFSQAFVVDSIGFNDRNYVNINAHELAHHWFGNLITEESGTHHWLQEGFATYYAQLAEREIFGDDYFFWKIYNTAEQLKELSDQGKGEVLMNPKASSLTFYEKGAWALHILRDKIGDEAFTRAVRNYLTRYSFKNVTTQNFLNEVRKVTDIDIAQWEADWLKQSAFQSMQAFDYLSESEFMNNYFELFTMRKAPFSERINALASAIDSGNDYLGQEAVYQLAEQDTTFTFLLYKKALESDNLFVRQAVALSVPQVTGKLKPYFEPLLTDNSYLTREAALYTLWRSFPEEQGRFLDATDGMIGFHDKNVRQMWLALAIYTRGYREADKNDYIEELQSYANRSYSFEIRKKAFEYLVELQLINESVIDDLVNASVHHNWRFRNFARSMLTELLKGPGIREALTDKLDSYSEKERNYLNRIINQE